jgi:hypothetical protein
MPDDRENSAYPRSSCDKMLNTFGEKLIDFCCNFDCIIVNGLANYGFDGGLTFVGDPGASVVDYFIVSCDLSYLFKQCKLRVKSEVESDHFPVEMIFGNISCTNSPSNFEHKSSVTKIFWDESKVTTFQHEMSKEIDNITQAKSLVSENINEALAILVQSLLASSKCMEKRINLHKKDIKTQPWFDKECKQNKKLCKNLYRRFKRNPSSQKQKLFTSQRKTYFNLRRQKRRDFSKDTATNLTMNLGNSKLFWRDIKCLSGLRRSRASNRINVDEWHGYFCNLLQQSVHKDLLIDGSISDSTMEEGIPSLDKRITKAEIEFEIEHAKPAKAAGSDNIMNEMLKASCPLLIDCLVDVFNRVFFSGIFPEAWSKAIIVPIFKKGNPNITDTPRYLIGDCAVGLRKTVKYLKAKQDLEKIAPP